MKPENNEGHQNQTTEVDQIIGAMNFITREKFGPIPDLEALALMREGKKVPNNPNKQRGVWFDKRLIKVICDYISASEFDGVRIYYSKYLSKGYEKVMTRQGPQNYNKKHTVVIVPTRPAGGNTSEDDLPREEELQKLIEDFLDKGVLSAYNHGELCPPQTGCRT